MRYLDWAGEVLELTHDVDALKTIETLQSFLLDDEINTITNSQRRNRLLSSLHHL